MARSFKHANLNYMSKKPKPPQHMEVSILEHSPRQTVFEIRTNGLTSREIKNHVSRTIIEITEGVGKVAVEGMIASVQKGDIVNIARGTAYAYKGEMALRSTAIPPVIQEAVSLDGQALSKEGKKIVRQANRARRLAAIEDGIIQRLNPLISTFRDFEQTKLKI